MSEKLPRVTANEIIKIVEKLGFHFSRQSGSHKIYKNNEGKRLTIAYHSGKILHPKVVKSILVDAGLSAEKNMYEAIEMHIHGLIEDKLPIPESKSFAEYVAVAEKSSMEQTA